MNESVEQLLTAALARAAELRNLPESTYRLQLHKDFTFQHATAIIPYLANLGITHVYCSPYLKARPGSTHGYDVIDHCSLNPELGSQSDFDSFLSALKQHHLSHILDTVPNHVGVGTNENIWWNDILENGPASLFGHYFDIAWRASPRPELHDKVLLPLIGKPYAQALEAGELKLSLDHGALWVNYFDRRFPISPRTYPMVLSHDLSRLNPQDPSVMELLSILSSAKNLPGRSTDDPALIEERHREKEVIKRRLHHLLQSSPEIRQHVDNTLQAFNGQPGNPRSFDPLDSLLSHQCYRLADWHVAPDEINYRRFFDINDLAALSMERIEVFEATHTFTLSLAAAGHLTGLRIDHPDGLYDPAQYFQRLQSHYLLAIAQSLYQGDNWPKMRQQLLSRLEHPETPLYVTIEKILAPHETIPPDWLTHGTSGYDFLNEISGLFVDPAGEQPLTRLYQDFTHDQTPFPELVYKKKLLILDIALASELHMLAHQLDRIAQTDRHSRDFTFIGLLSALRQVISCFPVYRSYITDQGPHPADHTPINHAIDTAISRNPQTDPSIFHFIRDTLLLTNADHLPDDARHARLRFAGKFQQVTSPVTAKAIEDTAFYCYHRLISLNEVGGDPTRFGVSPADLHSYLSHRATHHPYSLSPLSTHDTKRSEDIRARLHVLSELPEEFRTQVENWRTLSAPHKSQNIPTPDEEYLLYQTLLGTWPSPPSRHAGVSPASLPEDFLPRDEKGDGSHFLPRIQAYMIKALRESKLRTSWTSPNQSHESSITTFIASLLNDQAFLSSFLPFQHRIAHLGHLNTLSQTLLRLTAPGVPDTYQGTELLDFSLVDPDNRRPVDYSLRAQLLSSNDSSSPNHQKLHLTTTLLHARKSHPGLFTTGSYHPLHPTGPSSHHLFSFLRQHNHHQAISLIPRLLARAPSFKNTHITLPPGQWRDFLTHRTFPPGPLPLDTLSPTFPLAILLSQ